MLSKLSTGSFRVPLSLHCTLFLHGKMVPRTALKTIDPNKLLCNLLHDRMTYNALRRPYSPLRILRINDETYFQFKKDSINPFVYFYFSILLCIHSRRHKNLYPRKRAYPLFFTRHNNCNRPPGIKHQCFFALPEPSECRIFFSLCKTFGA